MAYGSASGTAGLCTALTSPCGGDWGENTTPTETQVLAFLDDGSALMDAEIAQHGFTTPISASLVVAVLDPIAEYYAAALAESPQNVNRSDWQGVSESSKPTHWMDLYRDAMDRILSEGGTALSILGATKTVNLSEYVHAGGLSEDEKDTWEADSDYVQPQFKTGMMGWRNRDWTTV